MSRRAQQIRRLLVAALLAPCLLGVKRPPGLADVVDVRTWSHPGFTRVVVELSKRVTPRLERLPADAAAQRPERLYLDLDKVWVGRRYEDGFPIEDGLLTGVRVGQNTLQRSRIVLDLDHYSHHRLLSLDSPPRIVVDVYGPEAGAGDPLPSESERDARLSMGLRGIRRVVLDPGHGGADPGAIGIGGLREKDVNLRLALLLRTRLRARGFEVIMTRDGERTLDLEERTAIAESTRGDLFVSLHANAARRSKARGVEIYYLDANHERHSLEVAARENGVDLEDVDSLQRTLASFRVAEASVHSGRLAELVHHRVMRGLAVEHRDMPDLGVKTGPFYVLFLCSMPAILIEAGFVTNRQDAALLRRDAYLELLAEQIAAGLDQYRGATAQLAVGRLP